jgi:His-Xaa-Ser system protein HxsD
MSEINTTTLGDGAVAIELDATLYPRDAVYGAAFAFIDRFWVHLDRVGEGRIKATLRPKRGHDGTQAQDPAAIAGEFENELLGQAWRQQIADENHALVERVITGALGPGPAPGDASSSSGEAAAPGEATSTGAALDDLLAGDAAFDDPLGIALSWEEKFAKKSTQALDPAAAPIDDAPSTSEEPGE